MNKLNVKFFNSPSVVYALVAISLWSTVAVAFKWALAGYSVSWLIALSCVFAVLALLPLVWTQKSLVFNASAQSWITTTLTATLMPLAYYYFLFGAYDRLPAQIAQPINYTWSLVFALVVTLKEKRSPGWFFWAASFISYAGVVVLTTSKVNDYPVLDWLGVLLALMSTCFWAAFWLIARQSSEPEAVRLFRGFLVAAPMAIVVAWVVDGPLIWGGLRPSLSIVWIACFEMGWTFWFWGSALRLSKVPERISLLIFISPVISLNLIHFLLGEALPLNTWLGLVMIITGLLLNQLFQAKGKK